MKDSEYIILNELKKGNEAAYRYLYDHHYVLLCHFAYQYVNDVYLAETIVEEVIIHLWNTRETLQISTSLRSYLLKSVKNKSLDYLKSEYVRKELPFSRLMPEDQLEHSEFYPLGHLFENELEKKVIKAIKNLPEDTRKVFLMSRFEEKKYAEIAQKLNISVNTVKYHIKKAISLLRAELLKYLLISLYFIFY